MKGKDERLTSSEEVILLSALSSDREEITKLIESLRAAEITGRLEYWQGRLDKMNALYAKLSGAVSITVRYAVESDE